MMNLAHCVRKETCVFCGSAAEENTSKVDEHELKRIFCQCGSRQDKWASEVKKRVEFVVDKGMVGVQVHENCYVEFMNSEELFDGQAGELQEIPEKDHHVLPSDANVVDSFSYVLEICNNLAAISTQCSVEESISRMVALSMLYDHWKTGHEVNIVCLTCGPDDAGENSRNVFVVGDLSSEKLMMSVSQPPQPFQKLDEGQISDCPSTKELQQNATADLASADETTIPKHSRRRETETETDRRSSLGRRRDVRSCTECWASFRSASALKLHARTHNKAYVCCECERSFLYGRQLAVHLRTHDSVKPFTCAVCDGGFAALDNLKRHMMIHLNQKPYKCDVCGIRFAQSGNLRQHVATHSEKKPFSCAPCSKSFRSRLSLKYHNACYHSDARPFACRWCNRTFAKKVNLKYHENAHAGVKPHRCDVCQKAFQLSSSLKSHMRTHTGEKPYSCGVCKETFSSSATLRRHMRIEGHITGDEEVKLFVCNVCGLAFDFQCTLQYHMTVHTGDRPFQCQKCGQAFRLAKNLAAHMSRHTDERPNHCSVCGKNFKASTKLKDHMKMHADEAQSFQCSQCGEVLSGAKQARRHVKMHAAADRFRCRLCVEGFVTAKQLKVHQKIQHPQTTYRCLDCDAEFADESELSVHCTVEGHLWEVRKTPGVETYVCVCGCAFSSAKTLKQHARRHTCRGSVDGTLLNGDSRQLLMGLYKNSSVLRQRSLQGTDVVT